MVMQRVIIPLIASVALWSCSTRRNEVPNRPQGLARTQGVGNSASGPPQDQSALAYPHGPWWGGDMRRLYVSAAHILVTHINSEPVGILPGMVKSTRSREEALAKVRDLQAQLERNPARFAELAARDSDDGLTAPLGGVIGTFPAGRLPPELVDALGHLRPSEISHVVESSAGFHLIRRLAAPPATPLSFAHIVIKHDAAMGWKRVDREVPDRSRAAAQSLAHKIADEAKRDPTRFAELVSQYSEADDVVRGGDLGELTPYDDAEADATFFTRVSRLAPAEVSDLLETPAGFEIVQRTPNEARELRAASVITLPYRGAQSNTAVPATRSKEKAQKMAAALVSELQANPTLFAERRMDYCELYGCRDSFRFRRGKELSAVDAAVGKLRVGELATVDSPVGILVVRREDPAAIADKDLPPLTEFPTEDVADAEDAPPQPSAGEPAAGEAASPADLVAEFAEHALRALNLEGDKASRFSVIFAELTSRMRAQPESDYVEDVTRADAQILALLGEDKNEEFLRYRRRYVAQRQ
jgi:peptidyl-prolyl cis-trans isomerase NIMA-interacting 1